MTSHGKGSVDAVEGYAEANADERVGRAPALLLSLSARLIQGLLFALSVCLCASPRRWKRGRGEAAVEGKRRVATEPQKVIVY